MSLGTNIFRERARAVQIIRQTRDCRLAPEFEEMRDRLGGIEPATDQSERKRLLAEIDGAAFFQYCGRLYHT